MLKAENSVWHVQRVKEYRNRYHFDVIESHRASVRLYEKVDRMMQLRKVQDQIDRECNRLAKEVFDLRQDHSEMIDKVFVSRFEFGVVQTSAVEHYEKNKHKYKENKMPAKDFPKDGLLI